MNIALLQTDIKWADSLANQKAAESALSAINTADDKAVKPDLYILPEMFSTGFATKPDGIAETDDNTLMWMKRMADKYDAAIAGSVAVRTNDNTFHNRLYFVKPGGEVEYYDKRHLFTYGGEDKFYQRGNQRVIVEWRGVRFLLQICYDLRFPCFARNTPPRLSSCGDGQKEEQPYDAIIYVANWPDSRRRVWDILLQARALENQCYVLGVNRVGNDEVCHYDGGTVIIDAYGKTLARATDDTANAITADLDIQRLKAFRQKFPVLNDAD